MLSSTVRKAFTFSAALRSGAFGNGNRVIGRIMPTLMPRLRASTIAFFETREVMPTETTQISASSIMYSSQRHSSFSSFA